MKYLVYLFIFFCFFYKGIISLDPDFGWHLRMGQVILSSGIPNLDPFSYSMPGYPFVDLSWLSGVFLALIYPKFGMIGLSFIAALISISSLFVALSIKLTRGERINSNFKTCLLILGAGALFPFESIRIQVISWLFIAILLKIVLEQDHWAKRRYLLPGLFLLWANLHGSFAVGLLVLGLVLFVRSRQTKNLQMIDFGILFSSFLMTLINPYGFSLYGEVAKTLWGSNLSGKIMEWMPAIYNFNLSFIALIPLSVLIVWHYRKKFPYEVLILFFGFLAASFLSQRHIPIWIMISLPVLLMGYNYFSLEIKKVKFGVERMEKLTKFVLIGCLFIYLYSLVPNLLFSMTEENFYPRNAVKYLEDNLPKSQIFSEYGWGGYLIWQLPEKKVYIDGRMCTWSGIMEENEAVLSGKVDYKEVFNKYNVETILWPKSGSKTVFDLIFLKIHNLLDKGETSFSLFKQIENDGWHKVYEDSVAVIYEAPKEN
jgi:hypothetical protein